MTRLIFILIVALVMALPALVYAQSEEAAVRAAELEQLRTRIQALRQTLERDLSRHDRARTELRLLEQTVARHATELRATDRRLQLGQRRLDSLRGERGSRERELGQERAALAGQLRAAYAVGRQDRLKLLLNQEDPAAVGRMLVYHDYFNRTRLERMQRVTMLIDDLAVLEQDIVAEAAALELERLQQRQALQAIESTRAERATVVAAIERELRNQGQQLQRMESDERSLAQLLESLSNLLADVPADLGEQRAFSSLRGQLSWPMRGAIIGRYGQPREGGARWRGILIRAASGTEVRAVAYGRVAWAGWMPHYGNLMVLDHGNDYFTLYGHNQAMLREVGEWVNASDVIAQVGDSGGQAQAALYFEMRKGRDPLNPSQWLGAR